MSIGVSNSSRDIKEAFSALVSQYHWDLRAYTSQAQNSTILNIKVVKLLNIAFGLSDPDVVLVMPPKKSSLK